MTQPSEEQSWKLFVGSPPSPKPPEIPTLEGDAMAAQGRNHEKHEITRKKDRSIRGQIASGCISLFALFAVGSEP
jgi:hypothetical protein